MCLTSYLKMTTKCIVQILRETTAKILQIFGTTDTSETNKYCQMLDQFFECGNARRLEKHQKKTKPFLKLYTDENHEIIFWITNQFLEYLNARKENAQNRSGDFTQNAGCKMFVSLQTYHGIQIIARSTVEVVKLLLQITCKFILTKEVLLRPCGRILYGIQRQPGRRNDSPDMVEFR